jgi:hypothetical protein
VPKLGEENGEDDMRSRLTGLTVVGIVTLVAGLALLVGVAHAQRQTTAPEGTTANSTQDKVAVRARLKNFTKTSTKPQSDDTNVLAENARITAPVNSFSFNRTAKIVSINKVTITATINDGDTGLGDFDENDLVLALDGIGTGIALNGFRDNVADTRTNTGTPNHARQIRAALKQDGRLAATIIDRTPADNTLTVPANFESTLRINGKIRRGR